MPIKIIDTAGLRMSKNEVESHGISRSIKLVKNADLVLVVVDVKENKPLQVVDNIDLMSSNMLMVYNKIDLKRNIKYSNKNGEAVYVSALNNTGISKLKKNILIKLNMEKIPNKLSGVSTPRQYECIQNSIKSVEEANNILTNLFQLELICYELETALININLLLGVNTEDLVLNNMFDSFCVGK